MDNYYSNSFILQMDIITGEKIQNIADVAIVDNYNPNNKIYSKQMIFITEIEKYFDVINNSTIIYIRTDLLDAFLKNIYHKLNNKYIIITHNSDKYVGKEYIDILNDEKITTWFSQNINIEHEKLFAIPIGIANSQWKHGNLEILKKIMNMNIEKVNLLYSNFKTNTNTKERTLAKNILIKNGFAFTEPNLSWETYLIELKKSKFSICPYGNGIDCHRIWESLYLDTIPIVISHVSYSQFNELPMLMISDWNIITKKFLDEQYEIIKHNKLNNYYKYEKLYMDYWINILSSYNI